MALITATLPSTGTSAATAAFTVGETPGAAPSDIFPLAGCAEDSLNNVQQFQDLMFRPLYWYGLSGATSPQSSLSPANAPTTNAAGTVVTLKLKGWRFADGSVVDADAALFFLNLADADPTGFCDAEAGHGIPGALRSARASGETLTLTFSSPVNLDWLAGNDLSNVVPLDLAWDRTATSSDAGCATGTYGTAATLAACRAVATYLQTQGTATTTFARPFWQDGVDGPWRLSSFDAAGDASFAPNAHYSGPTRPRVSALRLVAYSSAVAEETALANGSLVEGTVPASYVPATTKATGANAAALAGRDTLYPTSTWSFNGIEVNFNAQGASAALIDQLYVRSALQQATDQSAMIDGPLRGYATASDSPLPAATTNSLGRVATNPYPYNATAARATLNAHGWTVQAGQATCTAPGTGAGECGAGVLSGTPLALSMVVASGDPVVDQELTLLRSEWSAIGVTLEVTFATSSDVASDCAGDSGYQLCWSGQGWDYLGDYYPSGDVFFSATPTTSLGGYVNASMTKLIDQSLARRGSLAPYATYAASQLPVLYLPSPEVLWEVAKKVACSRPLRPNPLGLLTPEYCYFS